jgi:hypothetical protein
MNPDVQVCKERDTALAEMARLREVLNEAMRFLKPMYENAKAGISLAPAITDAGSDYFFTMVENVQNALSSIPATPREISYDEFQNDPQDYIPISKEVAELVARRVHAMERVVEATKRRKRSSKLCVAPG